MPGDRAGAASEPVEWLRRRQRGLFGYNPARGGLYPPRWWIVLSGTLVAARLLAAMVGIFAGPLVVAGHSAGVGHADAASSTTGASSGGATPCTQQFPDALAMIVRAVRVGVPLGEGIRTVAREAPPPTGGSSRALRPRRDRRDAGGRAAGNGERATSLPEYRFFTTALALQSQTGGGLSEALESLADVIRRRLALKAARQRAGGGGEDLDHHPCLAAVRIRRRSGGAEPAYIGRLVTEPGCQKVLLPPSSC